MLKYPSVPEIKSVYTSFPKLRVNTQTSALVHIGNAPGFVRIFFACLKGPAQAKIMIKSVILFRVLNMTI